MTGTPNQSGGGGHTPGTPLPWKAVDRGPRKVTSGIIATDGENDNYFIGITDGPDKEANARYIVHACNLYPELLEALEAVVASSPIEDSVLPMVLAAIAKARGQ